MSDSGEKLPGHNNSGLSRRDLFRTAGLATGGALLLGLPNILSGQSGTAEAAIQRETYTGFMVLLELDGQFAGRIATVDGGGVFADIVVEPLGQIPYQLKRPGPPRFEDIVLDVTLGAIEKPLSGWLTDTLTKNAAPKNGVIIYADLNNNEIKRLEFTDALLTEVTLSEAGAANAKDPVLLTLKLTPQSTRLTGGKGKVAGVLGTKQKQILSSNFRFNVQGLESSCARIASVEGIGVSRIASGPQPNQEKFRQPFVQSVLNCSTVRILVPEMDAGPFYAWFDEMVIKGNPLAERGGLLEWFDPTMKNVVASVQFGGLGIVRYEPDPTQPGAKQKVGLVAVDMYCETMNILA